MKTIKFGNNVYELVDNINVDATRFQATVFKAQNTFDSIINAVKSATDIKVYEDDTLIGQYEGYTKAVSFSVHPDEENDLVSIELQNTDYDTALNNLQATVDTHTESIESIDAGITDLATEITDLNESQLSQDAAIEDLAESMAEMEV